MAHEIETHGTQAAAVFARKDAWHRLGTTVRDRAFTAEEAMSLGHLGGWDVRKLPLTTAEVSDGGQGKRDRHDHDHFSPTEGATERDVGGADRRAGAVVGVATDADSPNAKT